MIKFELQGLMVWRLLLLVNFFVAVLAGATNIQNAKKGNTSPTPFKSPVNSGNIFSELRSMPLNIPTRIEQEVQHVELGSSPRNRRNASSLPEYGSESDDDDNWDDEGIFYPHTITDEEIGNSLNGNDDDNSSSGESEETSTPSCSPISVQFNSNSGYSFKVVEQPKSTQFRPNKKVSIFSFDNDGKIYDEFGVLKGIDVSDMVEHMEKTNYVTPLD